jgi:hypothetical protein
MELSVSIGALSSPPLLSSLSFERLKAGVQACQVKNTTPCIGKGIPYYRYARSSSEQRGLSGSTPFTQETPATNIVKATHETIALDGRRRHRIDALKRQQL